MVIYHSKVGDLMGLFLERTVENNNNIYTFDTRIYSAMLRKNYINWITEDVSDCASLSEDACKDIAAIEKTLVFNGSDASNFVGELEAVGSQIEFINFETLSILYNDDKDDGGVYTTDGMINLVMIADNAGLVSTPFIYMQYDDAEPTISPTTKPS